MRRLSILALCLISACAPGPTAQVTKNSPADSGAGLTLPAIQGFAAAAATPARRGNGEIARDFLDLAFRMESGRTLPVFTRFEGPITVGMSGAVPNGAGAELGRLIGRFRAEAGIDIRPAAAGETPSITIDFHPRAALGRVVPTAACFVVPNVSSLAEYKRARGTAQVDWARLTRRDRVAIMVPSDTSPQEVRDCLHEELAQAMGPLNDLYHLPDSVFNDDNFHTVLTGFDMLVLRMHYSSDLRSGMNEAEVARALPGLLARMNPGGEGVGGEIKQIAPRSWVSAVEQAFGVRGGSAGAADRMMSIAMAQGWRDSRLAFSHYAVGRASLRSDRERAVRAFAEAGRIYRSLPGGAVHAAHADMQLAAIALSAGQPGQAIAFADRAIPVVKSAENAALLATLMMIKAEALEVQGNAAGARALRLDSLGWARYGFGSERQVRARMSEISSLAGRARPAG